MDICPVKNNINTSITWKQLSDKIDKAWYEK
jgi:hypothetical protein